MRILILRCLLGWWFIPIAWLTIFPIVYLLSGNWKDAKNALNELSDSYWNGYNENI